MSFIPYLRTEFWRGTSTRTILLRRAKGHARGASAGDSGRAGVEVGGGEATAEESPPAAREEENNAPPEILCDGSNVQTSNPVGPESDGTDPARASMRSTGRARDVSNGSEGTVAF